MAEKKKTFEEAMSRLDEIVTRLEKGDTTRLQADVPHAYRGAGPGDTELHMLIYYQG